MLQEVLLSLSGIRSPLWDQMTDVPDRENGNSQLYISEPEQAMLKLLANISNLHTETRTLCSSISASHPSLSCRAVSNAIVSKQLTTFQNKIVEVERSIIKQDADYVGAYNIVPLSTLVTLFSPWEQKFRWLVKIAGIMQDKNCTGARLLQTLDSDRLTGYADIAQMATDLLIVGQQTWLQSLIPWILYGRLPSHGVEDFMIQVSDGESSLKLELKPSFVTIEAAHTILAIGRSLAQLQLAGVGAMSLTSASTMLNKVTAQNLGVLKALQFPLQHVLLEKSLFMMNEAISRNALSELLPLSNIMEVLAVFQSYIFLGNGEFSSSLIMHAQEHLNVRTSSQSSSIPVRKLGRLEDLVIKDAELATILSRSWSEMASFQDRHEVEDPIYVTARNLIQLRRINDTEHLVSTLLPTPCALDLVLPSNSPINLFLSESDRSLTHGVNALLCSIRRANVRLSGLWKLTTQRRFHPAPLGPPMSASKHGQEHLKIQRQRGNMRNKQMRKYWASVSKSRIILSELGEYFHAQVIEKNWGHLQEWLSMRTNNHPKSASLSGSRPPTASSVSSSSHPPDPATKQMRTSGNSKGSHNDPRTLARAYQAYLENIYMGLFLRQKPFISKLKLVLQTTDHFIALFERLQNVWEGLDLQEDEGVLDAFSNYVQDEKELILEMDRCRDTIESYLLELVESIKSIEKERSMADMTTGFAGVGLSGHQVDFVPLKWRTLDRLIMKLDLMVGGVQDDGVEAELNIDG